MLSFHELKSAIDKDVVSDVSLIPTYDEIRAHKAAIDFVRRPRAREEKVHMPITRFALGRCRRWCRRRPRGEGRTFRKETPSTGSLPRHRGARQDSRAREEAQRLAGRPGDEEVLRAALASKLHFKIMRVFPFRKHGKLARLAMNLVCCGRVPPAIIHATERQRYYEPLRGPSLTLHNLMLDVLDNSWQRDQVLHRARSGRRARVAFNRASQQPPRDRPVRARRWPDCSTTTATCSIARKTA